MALKIKSPVWSTHPDRHIETHTHTPRHPDRPTLNFVDVHKRAL